MFVRCVYDDAMTVVCFELMNGGFPVIVRNESFDRDNSHINYFEYDAVKMVDAVIGRR